MKNDEISAFPFQFETERNTWISSRGMTMRDYFAAAALPSLITTCADLIDLEFTDKHFAQLAYKVADAMIVEREK